MVRAEMLRRMSAEEFVEWMAVEFLATESSDTSITQPVVQKQQTPEEMVSVLKSLVPKKTKKANGRIHR